MSLLRNLFSPPNSLILTYDHLDDSNFEEFKLQLEEVGRYYSFCKLSDLSQPERRKRARGAAAVVFENARRSVFVRAAPFLISQEIAFTVMINPECVGSNRLPLVDEQVLYEKHLGKSLPVESDDLWNDYSSEKARQDALRVQWGPLPINELDPLFYFATWGQIISVSPAAMEIGFRLFSSPQQTFVAEAIRFARTQVKREIKSSLTDRLFDTPSTYLNPLGIHTLVLPTWGEVTPQLSAFELPRFRFQIASPS